MKLMLFVGVLSFTNWLKAADFEYEKSVADNHIVHIVTIKPAGYEPSIAKANEGKGGREHVSAIAKRRGAEIAINGGYFEIASDHRDGMPSGSLVIQGHVYKLATKSQALFLIDNGNIWLGRKIPKEIALNKNISLVSGIPMLVENGTIPSSLEQATSDFSRKAHARTAIGIKKDKSVVILVAEHLFQKDPMSLTMKELQEMLNKKGDVWAAKYQQKSPGLITINQLKEILKEEYGSKSAIGLSLLETAQWMKKLGCQEAINLDGGGSSTLWIQGKVINHAVGDADEAAGLTVERPVSDAILFSKK